MSKDLNQFIMNINENYEVTDDSSIDFEVTVSAPKTTDEFISFLRSQNCKANVGTNPNYPGKVWLGPNPNNGQLDKKMFGGNKINP